MIKLSDNDLYYPEKSILIEIIDKIDINYERDPSQQVIGSLHTGLKRIREELFTEENGVRMNVPHIGNNEQILIVQMCSSSMICNDKLFWYQ